MEILTTILPILSLYFNFISFGTSTRLQDKKKPPGEKLCIALQGMGTTFIKLGQFLATRPDIIGEELAKDLEKLQDKVPAFELYEAKKVIKKVLERHELRRNANNQVGESV